MSVKITGSLLHNSELLEKLKLAIGAIGSPLHVNDAANPLALMK
jgi:hypothetical protein